VRIPHLQGLPFATDDFDKRCAGIGISLKQPDASNRSGIGLTGITHNRQWATRFGRSQGVIDQEAQINRLAQREHQVVRPYVCWSAHWSPRGAGADSPLEGAGDVV
jgi:hypothetical protein